MHPVTKDRHSWCGGQPRRFITDSGRPAGDGFKQRLADCSAILPASAPASSRFETVNASPAAVLESIDLHALHQVSFWDALILQAARQSGCVQLLTEDLQAGAVLGGVRIVNPFDSVAKPRATSRR